MKMILADNMPILLLDTLSMHVFGSLSVDLLDISVCQILNENDSGFNTMSRPYLDSPHETPFSACFMRKFSCGVLEQYFRIVRKSNCKK